MLTYTFRLLPGQDLLNSINDFVRAERIGAGCILTCTGSLTRAALRFANKSEATIVEGSFEIISLVGTIAMAGPHLHLSISDGNGKMSGGHLMEGCTVYTTAEIVIGVFPELVYRREFSAESGYAELVVYSVQEGKVE
jgi:predicted DNA-binding protein with PD1-like motif